ncbi:hypothetical protein N9B63_01845 [Akkermansiaceae bacterium]|nr:hypothetical protein [Akkermansiaceae bacterium]
MNRLFAKLRITSRSQPLGQIAPQLNLFTGHGSSQSSDVGIHGKKLRSLDAVQGHPVEHIRTRPTEADDFY